jgi:hypothetical protein
MLKAIPFLILSRVLQAESPTDVHDAISLSQEFGSQMHGQFMLRGKNYGVRSKTSEAAPC